MQTLTFEKLDLTDLRRLAGAMTELFPTKLVIGLVGTLGAGKTTLTQMLASAMGVDPEDVTSPTFTLLCSYKASVAAGSTTLHHLDAYRVADEDEFLELGIDELCDQDRGWVVIEWADRVAAVLPNDTLWIEIQPTDEIGSETPTRSLRFRIDDAAWAERLQRLADKMAD